MKKKEIERFLTKYTDSQLFEITLNLDIDNPFLGTFSKIQNDSKRNIWSINEFISPDVSQQTELPGEFIVKIKPVDKD